MKQKRMPTVRELFPRASQSTVEANPQLADQTDQTDQTEEPADQPHGHGVRGPNQTEREFGVMLAAQKIRGEIIRYEFEGIRLKWGVYEKTGAAMWYKPDYFIVVRAVGVVHTYRCTEVKGSHIWKQDIIRFKGARAAWPEFEFEMWQKKEGRWSQLM
jgi:hypothetical protein